MFTAMKPCSDTPEIRYSANLPLAALAVLVLGIDATAPALGDFDEIFGNLEELCASDSYIVTTTEEGGDPRASGYLSNDALCDDNGEPCTLRAALNTANLCNVGLHAGLTLLLQLGNDPS